MVHYKGCYLSRELEEDIPPIGKQECFVQAFSDISRIGKQLNWDTIMEFSFVLTSSKHKHIHFTISLWAGKVSFNLDFGRRPRRDVRNQNWK